MFTSQDEIKDNGMGVVARRDPKLFNKLWKKGAYSPVDYSLEIENFFRAIAKKKLALFSEKYKLKKTYMKMCYNYRDACIAVFY